MKGKTRRKLEMGTRAFDFLRAHPETSDGYSATLAELEALLSRAADLAARQRDGMLEWHSAAVRKRDLLRTMRRAHLAHLREVARLAARELPGLPQKFRLSRGTIPYLTFRTAARGMAEEALSLKAVLVQHGLSDTVLDGLAVALEQFDQAVEQGAAGRVAQVGASADLDLVADRVVRMVKTMDGLSRIRFAHDGELLAAWESASHVIATPRPAAPTLEPEGAPPAADDLTPAA
jgi:hypothetical protein